MIDAKWLDERLGAGFSDGDLLAILECSDEETVSVFEAARRVRAGSFGRRAYLRAVIEFSNNCRCNCHYCGMRKDNRQVERFLLTGEQILAAARTARGNGIRTFFLQSAETPDYPAAWLADLVREISSMDMAVLLCVGVHDPSDLDLWRDAGASKFILKHESADPELFARVKPGLSLEDRISELKTLREHGYEIGSGPLLGLPGQTPATLVADLRLLEELGAEMTSVSVFLPARGTPFEALPPGSVDLGLRFVAAMRLLLGNTLIPATSTFERLRPGGQLGCFEAGANVITVNMTPPPVRESYELYSRRFFVSLEHARSVIRSAGLVEFSERASSKPILVAGPPFSGKTTAGAEAARILGMPFVDLDEAVERRAGMPIPSVFEKLGEPAFRALEKECLTEALEAGGPLVMALGGGTLLDGDSLGLALSKAVVVTLTASTDTLLERLSAGRPLASDRRALLDLLAERREHYEGLPGRVDTTGSSPGDSALGIIAAAVAGS